jgi:putative transposase
MGWKATCTMDERMRFMVAVEKAEESFAAICRRFEVSRRVGYKWVERFEAEGVAGLFDRSRAPLRHPQEIGPKIAEHCLAVRRAHPSWGPVKVRAYLQRQAPRTDWPAASTIGELFDRESLTVKRKLRRRSPPSSAPFAHCEAANDVWCIDFKGWFLTGDGKRCEPLTLTDAHSRYLLRCPALSHTDTEHVWPVIDAAFREFGLPCYMRSDNGSPFASCGAGGLSKLSVKLIKAGVTPERIAPGKPQQNGRHERMHLTLLQEVANPPAHSMREQHKRLRDFRRLYNEERPHQALDNATPAERYQISSRRFDGILREPVYDDDQDVRRVRHNGEIKLNGNLIYISAALVGEPIGLAENDAGWVVSYGPIELGTIAHRDDTLRKPKRKGCGLADNATRCPQGPQPAATDLNETRIVLPMSSV